MKRLIEAIRTDELVGRGTCTSIDECYSDADLATILREDGITTPREAIVWARESEGLWIEQGLNASSGEADCPLRATYDDWQERTKGETS